MWDENVRQRENALCTRVGEVTNKTGQNIDNTRWRRNWARNSRIGKLTWDNGEIALHPTSVTFRKRQAAMENCVKIFEYAPTGCKEANEEQRMTWERFEAKIDGDLSSKSIRDVNVERVRLGTRMEIKNVSFSYSMSDWSLMYFCIDSVSVVESISYTHEDRCVWNGVH